jgi:hypothetical protein
MDPSLPASVPIPARELNRQIAHSHGSSAGASTPGPLVAEEAFVARHDDLAWGVHADE